MRRKILRFSLLIGVFLFVLLFCKIGPAQIWAKIQQLTWRNFLILFGLRWLYWSLRTLNWKIVFERYGRRASFFHLFGARMAGHAFSYLTPSALLGGEAIRAMSVRDEDRGKCFASVVVDKTIEFLTIIGFVVIGLAVALTKIPIPLPGKIFLIVTILGAALLVLLLFFKQRRGFFLWLINCLKKVKIRFALIEKNREKLQRVDTYISAFYSKHKAAFSLVVFLYALSYLFWTYEIHMTLVFMGADNVTFLESFLIVSLGTIAFFIPAAPASLGTYEIIYVGLFALFGLKTDAGMTLTLVRRIISLFYAGIGLLVMMKRQVRMKSSGGI